MMFLIITITILMNPLEQTITTFPSFLNLSDVFCIVLRMELESKDPFVLRKENLVLA